MKKIIYTLIFLFSAVSLVSQMREIQGIVVLSRNYGDSVVIRWAPTSPSLWIACNKAGYSLEKVIEYQDGIDEDSIPIIKERYEPVRNEVFKPLPLEAMIKRYEDEKHPMGMIATEFLYGDIDLRGEDHGFLSTITAEAEAQNMRFAYSLFAADMDADVANALGLRYSFKTKGIKDSTLMFRLISLVDTTKFKSDTLNITIDVFEVDPKPFPPNNLFTQSGEGHIKLNWVRDRNYTAYYIERSTDSINFSLLNKEPFLSSSAEGEEIREQFLPDSNFADTIAVELLIPKPLYEYNVYVDSVKNDVKYYYRIYGIDAFGDKSEYSEVVSGEGEYAHPLVSPSEVKAELMSDGRIKISWKEPDDKTRLRGYLIAHANEFGQDQYNLVTEELVLPGTTECYHKNVKEGSYNIYIVSAIDDKGRYVKSSPVSIYVQDTIPPNPPTGVEAVIDSAGVTLITWNLNDPREDVTGYKVYTSYDRKGTFFQITDYPVESNSLLDYVNVEFLNKKIYYRVVAVDRLGQHSDYSEICETKIPDIHPPITPVVKSSLVRNDGVDIKFIVGNDFDAKYYHIMRRVENADFTVYKTLLSSEVKNSEIYYRDTIGENGYYEYAIITEDEDGLRSKMSQVIPVTISKSEGANILIKAKAEYSLGNNSVVIKWNKPKEIKRDEFHYVLFKRETNASWQMYDSVSKNVSEYVDSKVIKGKQYEYKVVPYADGVSIGYGEVFTVSVK